MKQFKRLLIVPAMLVLVFAAAATSAVADHGNSSADSADTSSSASASESSHSMSTDMSSSDSGHSSSGDSSTTSDQSSSSSNETEKQAEDSYRQKADSIISEMLSNRNDHQSSAVRARKCQAAQHGLETKLVNMQKNAAKYQSLIDKIYSQALAYQQQNNLNPANFASLVSTANADQAKAAQSVGALSNLSANLDCSSSSVANNVETFKIAAQQARSDLFAYRKAVIAVLQALESAK